MLSHTQGVAPPVRREAKANGSSPEHAFLWVVLILALGLWSTFSVMMISSVTAMRGPVETGAPGAVDTAAIDAGGAGWVLIEVVGAAALGLALLYGLYRYYTRDRRLDPLTEAATRDAFEHPRPAET